MKKDYSNPRKINKCVNVFQRIFQPRPANDLSLFHTLRNSADEDQIVNFVLLKEAVKKKK